MHLIWNNLTYLDVNHVILFSICYLSSIIPFTRNRFYVLWNNVVLRGYRGSAWSDLTSVPSFISYPFFIHFHSHQELLMPYFSAYQVSTPVRTFFYFSARSFSVIPSHSAILNNIPPRDSFTIFTSGRSTSVFSYLLALYLAAFCNSALLNPLHFLLYPPSQFYLTPGSCTETWGHYKYLFSQISVAAFESDLLLTEVNKCM